MNKVLATTFIIYIYIYIYIYSWISDSSVLVTYCKKIAWAFHCFNPLVPSAHKSKRIAKLSILNLGEIIKKISYERRDYESEDENSLP